MTMRSHDRVRRLFDGFTLVDSGVVHLPLWRPESLDEVDERPERFAGLAAIGRKP